MENLCLTVAYRTRARQASSRFMVVNSSLCNLSLYGCQMFSSSLFFYCLTEDCLKAILKKKVPDTETLSRLNMLQIKITDIHRATLPVSSGNEGWIGISPTGNQYHVVVPVDVQIARGVLACNLPKDGTPFGGYSGWLYFRCPPFESESGDEDLERQKCVARTAEELVRFLESYDIRVTLVSHENANSSAIQNTEIRDGSESSDEKASPVISCDGCGKEWDGLAPFLRDQDLTLIRYKAFLEDFPKGSYVFSHSCGSNLQVPVSRFVRPRSGGKSLIASHACPGLCYYETSLLTCSAACDGSLYRRIAGKLSSKS